MPFWASPAARAEAQHQSVGAKKAVFLCPAERCLAAVWRHRGSQCLWQRWPMSMGRGASKSGCTQGQRQCQCPSNSLSMGPGLVHDLPKIMRCPVSFSRFPFLPKSANACDWDPNWPIRRGFWISAHTTWEQEMFAFTLDEFLHLEMLWKEERAYMRSQWKEFFLIRVRLHKFDSCKMSFAIYLPYDLE